MNPVRMSRRAVCWLTCIVLLVPLGSLYLGYTLVNTLTPYTNILPDPHVLADPSQLDLKQYLTHNLTIHFTGGLGAQMFQYAALYGLAKANGLHPVLPSDVTSARMLQVFPFLQARRSANTRPGYKYAKYREAKSHAFDMRAFSLNYMQDIELLGAFQSWRYFDHVRAEVKQQFSFSRRAVAMVQSYLRDAYTQAVTSQAEFGQDLEHFPVTYVGIHIRRGEFLKIENIEFGYRAADVNYLQAAMHFFRHKYKNVIFVVASDDLDWCEGHVPRDPGSHVVFSGFQHEGLDMCLLSELNHTIVTTGAFGWWGAWLAGGMTLYYPDYPVPHSQLAKSFRSTDYYTTNWLPVTS